MIRFLQGALECSALEESGGVPRPAPAGLAFGLLEEISLVALADSYQIIPRDPRSQSLSTTKTGLPPHLVPERGAGAGPPPPSLSSHLGSSPASGHELPLGRHEGGEVCALHLSQRKVC